MSKMIYVARFLKRYRNEVAVGILVYLFLLLKSLLAAWGGGV